MRRLAVPAQFAIRRFIRAVRHLGSRQVGQRFKKLVKLGAPRRCLSRAAVCAQLQPGGFLEKRRSVLAARLGGTDLAADEVETGLGFLGIGLGRAP
jgi:hypothetical protein